MELLSGNEAIARGAFEAGVRFASGYPGTPSSEILENLANYDEVYTQWSPNEKVALEVGIGASLAGARTLVTMKHVGLNVAADPFFTLAYTGVNAGLVIVSADDPDMHSSQNEQNSRYYAIAAKVPIIEPSDSQEAKDFLIESFNISERFDIPVLFRSTTRISHSKSIVEFNEPIIPSIKISYKKDEKKYVMIPAYAKLKRSDLEEKIKKIEAYNSEESKLNKIEYNDLSIGIITSSISYQYVKEVFPQASVLKLGMIYPFPKKLVKEFANKIGEIYVVEELERIIENNLKILGMKVKSKKEEFIFGELNVDKLKKSFDLNKENVQEENFLKISLPSRPPTLCAGCPHRAVFFILKKLKLNVCGDIGCYTLGTLPPLQCLDTCICMGASIGMANGMQKVRQIFNDNESAKTVAVIGDSTFVHSGITGLIDIIYNNSPTLVIILDNRTTAMTGHQDHPGTGKTLKGKSTVALDYMKLAKSIGIKNIAELNPYDIEECENTIKSVLEKNEASLLVMKSECILLDKKKNKEIKFISENCKGCKICLSTGCPALEYDLENKKIIKNELLCNNCGLCARLCKFDALRMITV